MGEPAGASRIGNAPHVLRIHLALTHNSDAVARMDIARRPSSINTFRSSRIQDYISAAGSNPAWLPLNPRTSPLLPFPLARTRATARPASSSSSCKYSICERRNCVRTFRPFLPSSQVPPLRNRMLTNQISFVLQSTYPYVTHTYQTEKLLLSCHAFPTFWCRYIFQFLLYWTNFEQ